MLKNSRLAMACLLVLVIGAGACSQNDEEAKQRYLASGDALAEQERYEDAVVEYRNAIRIDARFGEARYGLAKAYTALGDSQRAFQEYIRAADLLADDAEVQVTVGSLLLVVGQHENARARAEKALAIDPRNVDAQILLGNAIAGMKDLDGAIAEIEAAIALAPEYGRAYANLGDLQMAQGNPEEAERSFRRAIEVEPTSIPAQLALANFLWGTDRRDEAEAVFKTALELEPRNMLANKALVTFYLAGDTPERAEPYLVTLASDEDDTAAQIALGEFYLRLDRIDDARKVLTAAADEPGGFALARTRLAAIAFSDGRREEAYTLLDEVLAKEPGNLDAMIAKGRMLRTDGRLDEAEVVLRKAVDTSPEHVGARFELGLLLGQRDDVDAAIAAFREVVRLNPRASLAHLRLSDLLLSRGQAAQSQVAAEDALRNAPGDPDARIMLARSHLAQRDLAAAAGLLDELQRTHSSVAAVHTQIGTLRFLQGNPSAARAAYQQALSLEPGDVDAIRGLVAVDLMERKPDAALSRLERAIAEAPDDARLLVEAARVHGQSPQGLDKSEELLRRALQVDSSNLQAYVYLGQVFRARQKLPEAMKEFEAVAEKRPTSVEAHTMVAIMLQALGREADAIARYQRVLDINENAPVAANNLAWLYAEGAGNLDVALQLATRAHNAVPNQAEFVDTLGWIYYKKAQYPQAVRELTDAVALDPGNRSYQYRLGLAFARNGDVARARETLQQAIGDGQPFAEIDDARKALAELPS